MSNEESHLYEFGPYRLLPHERLLLRDGEPVALTPKAFEVLVVLVERCGRLVEKDELLNQVWAGTNVEEANIAQNVFALRRVLGRSESGGQYIETVPKCGYRFLASVTLVEDRGEELLVRQHVRASATQGGGRQTTTGADHLPFHALTNATVEPAATMSEERAASVTLPQTIAAEATRSVPRRVRKAGLLVVSGTLALALVGLGVLVGQLFLNQGPTAPPSVIKMSRLMTGMKIWSAAVSPDGRHVAHVVENAGQTSIWLRQVATTTDLHIIPSEPGAIHWGLSFSRDGDYIYYLKHAHGELSPALYRVPSLGGASRKIVAEIHSHVTTSPDSKQIAFVRDAARESVLMTANADGTNERRLAVRRRPTDFFSGGPRGGPSWSPDGQTIATGVISLTGGYHGELMTVSVSDGSERPLTSRWWHQIAQVAWLSDGSGLLAVARESNGAQIWHVSYPSGTVRNVTNNLNDYHGVSLTTDSRTLVTVQYDRDSTIAFVPEKPPSASKRTTAGMNEGFYGLSWTPDGKLVYASDAGGNLDIWLMGTDGITVERLTTDSHHDSTPSLSPDGRYVVFVSYRNGGVPHIWRMDIAGGSERQLTNQAFEGSPSFTADGRWVVYAAAGSGIWRVPADGGQPVLILGGDAYTPSVSPDGSLVACVYRENKPDTTEKIALVPTAGGMPVKIIAEPVGLSSPTIRWMADGRALIYVATREGVSNLWALPLDGSEPRTLTGFTSDLIFNFAWSRDYKKLAVARGSTAEHVILISDFSG